jgi:phage terminase large subunit-like protein
MKRVLSGEPVLRWMAGNVSIEQDAADNWKPSKKRSTERIDGIVALIMALGRATLEPGQQESIYAKRGLLSI